MHFWKILGEFYPAKLKKKSKKKIERTDRFGGLQFHQKIGFFWSFGGGMVLSISKTEPVYGQELKI